MNLYCKKTSGYGRHWDMVAPLWRRRTISSGSHASKVAKIMNQVGLIGVAVLSRNLAPVNISRTVYGAHYALQSSHAGKLLRGKADLLAKTSHEGLGKQAHTRTCLGNRRAALQDGKSECNCRVRRAGDVINEDSLEDAELGCWRGGLTHALAKQAALWSPDIFEFNAWSQASPRGIRKNAAAPPNLNSTAISRRCSLVSMAVARPCGPANTAPQVRCTVPRSGPLYVRNSSSSKLTMRCA